MPQAVLSCSNNTDTTPSPGARYGLTDSALPAPSETKVQLPVVAGYFKGFSVAEHTQLEMRIWASSPNHHKPVERI